MEYYEKFKEILTPRQLLQLKGCRAPVYTATIASTPKN